MMTASDEDYTYRIRTEADQQFTATEAALRIVGSNSTSINQADIARVLAQLKTSYLGALARYSDICEIDKEHRKEAWAKREPLPNQFIQSSDMQRCERILQIDPKGGTFTGWLAHSKTDFESQSFEREELQRWIDAAGIESAYRFHGTQPAPTPAPVVTEQAETKEQRQDRRLGNCEAAGLNFTGYRGRLPDGVGKIAAAEGVTRQAFSADVKAALHRRESAAREGTTVHRA